jgi:hypothetical protein
MATTPEYVVGPTYARRARPRFEFKPSAAGYTGGGYARVRSTERREHSPGDGADDVFVSVHRLAAVAWHLPDGTLGEDVSLSQLDGADVHHVQPDRDAAGMPAANGETWTTLVDHGTHSEITQAQVRAWGEDAKQQAADPVTHGPDGCAECGADADVLAESGAFEGQRCLECANDATDGTEYAIEL